uniref:Uncharacterized protein n=1 Tax=viral metagenome TaxID=1070528 RepID=A0A6M3LN48_9ZZZZ
MQLKCWDGQVRVWWSEHEWGEYGQCIRCGKWLPGISKEARAEMIREGHAIERKP